MGYLVVFGGACVAALLLSFCAKPERRALVPMAAIVGLNWLLFSLPWIYAPVAPAFIAHDLGLPAKNIDMWALADLLSLAAVGFAGWRFWWAPLVWTPYIINLTMYATAYVLNLGYSEYKPVLDMALTFQLAVIFINGGGDFADYLLRTSRRFRSVGHSSLGNVVA